MRIRASRRMRSLSRGSRLTERTRNAYERWAATYDTDPNIHTQLEYEPVLTAIAPTPGEKVLDAGCGTGRYSFACSQSGASVVGVDNSGAMLRIAQSKSDEVAFLRADLTRHLPFPNATFDKVNCAQVLKHLPSMALTMREFARVLRPDGRLVFSVTQPDMDWQGYELRAQPEFILSAEADIHHHSWADYESALREAGFGEIKREDIRASKTIANLLTPGSLARVRHRPQVLLCTARRVVN